MQYHEAPNRQIPGRASTCPVTAAMRPPTGANRMMAGWPIAMTWSNARRMRRSGDCVLTPETIQRLTRALQKWNGTLEQRRELYRQRALTLRRRSRENHVVLLTRYSRTTQKSTCTWRNTSHTRADYGAAKAKRPERHRLHKLQIKYVSRKGCRQSVLNTPHRSRGPNWNRRLSATATARKTETNRHCGQPLLGDGLANWWGRLSNRRRYFR